MFAEVFDPDPDWLERPSDSRFERGFARCAADVFGKVKCLVDEAGA
jgi:hypothetical protein